MKIFPAIDLYEGCAVRLLQGDYDKKKTYGEDPLEIAERFKDLGAGQIHLVDLQGAKTGDTPNLDIIVKIKEQTGLFVEVGGGIRSFEIIQRYIDAGIDRVILGTKAVNEPEFAKESATKYPGKIAAGADIKDGFIAIKGWTENSDLNIDDFLTLMADGGIDTVICTDISKDGMLKGVDVNFYKELSEQYPKMNIIASGGVSSMDDIKGLHELGLYGAIIGKAYYENKIDLKEAIEYSK